MIASTSVGSDIFAIAALVVVSIAVLILLRHYIPLRSTPAYLLIPVFLALALPCSIILLVPIDLASATTSEDAAAKAIWLPENVVLVTWRITYWLTFALTWFLLPFLGEYSDSGYLEPQSRAKDSLRSNARYQVIVLASASLGLVYFVLQNGFHWATLKGLIMALAYAWGLFLAIGLMGHGLVALPRRLFRFASVDARLRRFQTQAPKTKDRLDDAENELEEIENVISQLKQRKNGISSQLQDWIDELADTCAVPNSRPGPSSVIRSSNVAVPAVITERYMADLTRRLKRMRHKKARFAVEWTQLCDYAQELKTVKESATSKKLDFGATRTGRSFSLARISILTPTMRYHLHMNALPALRKGLAVLLAIASVLIVWSEMVKSVAPRLSVIGLTVVHRQSSDSGQVGIVGQIIAAAWLVYMDLCALYAIADVKVWGNRALVKRQTYAESACWYSLQVAKLTVPLSYNFITMLPDNVYEKTSFFKFLGKLIQITPLGQGFSAFFPCFLLLPVLASLFNVYGRVKRIGGFDVLEDESEENPTGFGTGGWREGQALIDREINAGGDVLGSSVGLSSRDASLDVERRLPARSTLSGGNHERTGASVLPTHVREANRQFNNITNQAEEEDDGPRHFYQDFTERVRNTIDTTDTPDWMKNIGSAFKTPKWLQNDQRDGGGSSALSKLFGGRPEGGRVRL